MWRRVMLGLAGAGTGLFAGLVFGIGVLEAYGILTSPPSGGGFAGYDLTPWWFPWSHIAFGGAGLVVASRLLRRAA